MGMAATGDFLPVAPSNRPYAPPSNVVAVLQRLRSRNLPERINAEFLSDAGIPDGTVGRTLFALRFLGLIDGDSPSTALREIASSTDEDYQRILSELIRHAYGEVFDVLDPARDDQARLVNFFRRYTPASQRERMVVFFLGVCREAGIPTMETLRRRPSSAHSLGRTARGKAAVGRAAAGVGKGSSREVPTGPGALPNAAERYETAGGLDPALEMLVRTLPPAGTPMSDDRREQWIQMARATLAFVYPVAEAPNQRSGNSEVLETDQTEDDD
jgi:hypothetical protein